MARPKSGIKYYRSKIILKCENCGREAHRIDAAGWTGGLGLGKNGRSKYGKKFDKKGGWAWWCTMPTCQQVKDRIRYRKMFPGLSDEDIDTLLDKAELDKIREN